jgi:FlaA1/EpsC-like NDP-sugar epimerase
MKRTIRDLFTAVAAVLKRNVVLRRSMIIAWQVVGLYVCYLLAFELRFDGRVPIQYWVIFWETLPVVMTVYLMVFALFRLYSGMWSYFSMEDILRMGLALSTATTVYALLIFALRGMTFVGFPRSAFVTLFLLMGFWMTGWRFATRYVKTWRSGGIETGSGSEERVLVVGKLDDADLLVRAARASGLRNIVAIITDEPSERGLTLHGIEIKGSIAELGFAAKQTRANCLVILPPFNRPNEMNRIVGMCADLGIACTFRTIPSMADLASGHMKASSIREVAIEDLLGRGTVRFDRTEVRRSLKCKRIMITGAGGSIGAELCRQIAEYEPAVMVLFESSEYALYSVDHELRRKFPGQRIFSCAGDIRHPEEIEAAIDECGGIDVIYHAAAYKHVPLMETNVPAAFRNNVLGTMRLADVAASKGVDRFVMISSDKAVKPSSIMGATKRIAERILQERPQSKTTFVSVRFGNVLGSSGSVVPLFKAQIAAGGPVTVTTPDTRRYFMTIPEAVDLVLLAGTIGRDRDIMVLDMGESIKIVDLAKRMIELSGLVPGKDIKIEFSGLRPGEKEYEEVMTEDENVTTTSHEKISVLRKSATTDAVRPVDLGLIAQLIAENDSLALRGLSKEYVSDHKLA